MHLFLFVFSIHHIHMLHYLEDGDYTEAFLQKKTYLQLCHNLCLYLQVIFCIVPDNYFCKKMMKHEMITFEKF